MSQKFDELVEGSLEIDVVLPERVIGIDDQVLTHHFLEVSGAR
jgi:hypothetical protein